MQFLTLFFSFLLFISFCFATYDWRDGQLPLERLQVVHSGSVKNSETKTDHHIPSNANFPPQCPMPSSTIESASHGTAISYERQVEWSVNFVPISLAVFLETRLKAV